MVFLPDFIKGVVHSMLQEWWGGNRKKEILLGGFWERVTDVFRITS